MRTRSIRLTLALNAFFIVLQWSNVAAADITITGTVGEISVKVLNGNFFRFKLTDLNQTKTCNSQPGYAFFSTNFVIYREWYAMLLVSKKGAPISCVLDNNTNCQVYECILP